MAPTEPADTPHSLDAHRLSFGAVAQAYARARPGYPPEAVRWLSGSAPAIVLELGAGTGKFTAGLLAAGHRVVATDPDATMLASLVAEIDGAHVAIGEAEHIAMPSRSVDVVVAAQSFHWFNHDVALREIARVLRPGGVLAVVWNQRDEAIPWVRRLGRIIGTHERITGRIEPLERSDHFGWVESETFRCWQELDRGSLLDLVASRSNFAILSEDERAERLVAVGELYDGYGRGADGMLLPYLTRCYRAVVRHQERQPSPTSTAADPAAPDVTGLDANAAPPPEDDGGSLLIDFR